MTWSWVADTEPNERLRLYTRGNVGEVFPNAMTPLTATLIGDAVRAAQTEVFVGMGALRPHEVRGPSVGTGVFGGMVTATALGLLFVPLFFVVVKRLVTRRAARGIEVVQPNASEVLRREAGQLPPAS